MEQNWRNLLLLLWLCTLVSLPSSLRAECPVTASGVCTPGVEETIVITETESIEYEADGHTVTTTTTTDTTTVTVTNEDSGNILDGSEGYVIPRYEGDMDTDWGGQGPANMPSGNNCYQLGSDKCAQITGSGNSTSTMGVSGMGTTFIQTVDISELDIKNGGRTNYSIKVDKRDAQDRIYMHITGKNGNTSIFAGTDILSESGVTSGYQEYTGGFDFAGTITKLVIEVGGRDINLAIGPLFDDVTINVLYNVVSTIVTQSITSVEMWVAYGGSTETEVIDIVENIFDHNDIVVPESPGEDMFFEPEFDEPDMEISYETVEMEMEIPSFEMELPEMEIEMPEVEVAVVEVEMEMEMELELEMPAPEPEMTEDIEVAPEPDTMESEPEMEETINEPEPESQPEAEAEPESVGESTEEDSTEAEANSEEESESEESVQETEADEEQPEDMEEPEDKSEAEEKPVKKPESKKEKAAKKIVKKMGDKGRYDSTNQLKTLIVMQVLGDTKSFFESQKQLEDRLDFFTDYMIPDAELQNNNTAQWFLFGGSNVKMDEMIMKQWQTDLE